MAAEIAKESSSSMEANQTVIEDGGEAGNNARWKKLQPWTRQLTLRGVTVSIIIGSIYSVIAMKLNLTTGLVPNLNVSAALLAFVFVRTWTKTLQKAGFVTKPFTRQENTMIQTCAVACYSIAVGGGFASYLLGMNRKTYELSGINTEGNSSYSVKEPGLGWMTAFLFVVCFVGLFVLIPLRKVFLSVALILGDGLYNFIKILGSTILNVKNRVKKAKSGLDDKQKPTTDEKKDEMLLRENIPLWVGLIGYTTLATISTIVIPQMFPQLKWYYVITAYILAPSLAFCNAYGAGLTDINMAYNYGKVALFLLAAVSPKHDALIAGLAGCGLVKSVVSVACILMQDFKTAHLTSTSPRAMFVSQLIGTAVGCVTAPLSFFLFYKAFDVGNPEGEFKAPYALIYRNMAILGVDGVSALPEHCLQICYGFFGFAIGVNLVKDFGGVRVGKWMPLPMVMAVPFLVGGYFAIDMCLGSLIVFIWGKINKEKAEMMLPAVASGLICGEGLWTLPASVLALAKINPPICMKFVPS